MTRTHRMSGTIKNKRPSPAVEMTDPMPILEAENEVVFATEGETLLVVSAKQKPIEEQDIPSIENLIYENYYERQPPKPTWWDRVKRFIQDIITRIKNATTY